MFNEIADSIIGIKGITKLNVVKSVKLKNKTLIQNNTLRLNQAERVRFLSKN
jgi:hypothetical protein